MLAKKNFIPKIKLLFSLEVYDTKETIEKNKVK